MSLADILEELPKLSERERLFLRDRLDDLAHDAWHPEDLARLADKRDRELEEVKYSL
jgi:hypothetical protein